MSTHNLVQLSVTLRVMGPVLTAGSAFATWGMDVAFYRNWKGKYAIPGSHVRGKLREAMTLLPAPHRGTPWSLEEWFGKESGMGSDPYAPARGKLKVMDFVLKRAPERQANQPLTRIRIQHERLSVEKGALWMMESPIKPNDTSEWEGTIEFFCDPNLTDACVEQLKRAFTLIANIGAEKTSGFGRLIGISFSLTQTDLLSFGKTSSFDTNPSGDGLKLAIAPQEPLFIGGIRRTENVFESEPIIPGAVLKGALAAGLNRIAGNGNLNSPITSDNSAVKACFPNLAAHFSDLIFLHAIPSLKEHTRSEAIPLSGAAYGGRYREVTFLKDEEIYADGTTPVAFQIDWKGPPDNLPESYRLPPLEYHSTTRTAIDPLTRKAEESKLYTMWMIKPMARSEGSLRQVYWNTEVRIPPRLAPEERAEITEELVRALPLALRYLGKRQCLVQISAMPKIKDMAPYVPDEFAIVLQTPAIIIDPEVMAKEAKEIFNDSALLHNQYQKFWEEILGHGVVLKRFFAAQELRGGYVGMRYGNGTYRPFYLTSAGSTFVLDASEAEKKEEVKQRVAQFLDEGMPLPKWVHEAFGEPLWQHCPYLRENGYGEIKIKTKEQ